MTTIVVHRIRLEDDSDLDEASVQSCFLNAGNEVLRIGPDARVVPWEEIRRVFETVDEDEAVVVRKCNE